MVWKTAYHSPVLAFSVSCLLCPSAMLCHLGFGRPHIEVSMEPEQNKPLHIEIVGVSVGFQP